MPRAVVKVVRTMGVAEAWKALRYAANYLRTRFSDQGLRDRSADEAGFTLVEVIVAMAILASALGILLSVISSSLQQTAQAEKMAAAVSLAQSLLAEVGTDRPITEGERTGELPNGYRWHLTTAAYGDAQERAAWLVGAYMVSAAVSWRDGTQDRSYTLTTLRLGPKQAGR